MANGQAQDDNGMPRPGRRLPLAVFLVVTLVSVLAWLLFNAQQRQQESQLLEQRLQGITVAFRDQMQIRGESLQRLALRQAAALDESERQRMFALDAPRYLRDFPVFSALYWVSPDGAIRQREMPGASRQRREGEPPVVGAGLQAAMARVRAGEPVVMSPTVEVAGVGPTTLLLAAGETDHQLRGYMLAVHQPGQVFPSSLAFLAGGSPMVVARDGEVIYALGEPGSGTARMIQLESYGDALTIKLWADPIQGWLARLDDALLMAGILAGLLMALAIWFSTVARQNARFVASTAASLRQTEHEAENARAALDLAERKMGAVFESISDALVTVDRQWRFTAVNSRAEQLMQRKAADLVGETLWAVFPNAIGTDMERQYRMAMDLREPAGFEVHFAPLGGWFSVRAYPAEPGLAIYFQDITERKSQEQAMLRAQAASDRAQRLARLGSCEHDPASGQVLMSDEALRIFGLAPSQAARGLPALLERVHFDDRARLGQAYRALHAGEGDLDIEYRVMAPDGEVRVVRELGTLARDAAGQPTTAALALQDITERQRAEQAQRELTRRLEQSLSMRRLVMDNSLDVICVLDANGRFVQVSEASRRVWGQDPNDMVGRPLVDFTHPDDRQAGLEKLAAVVGGQPADDFRSRFLRSDGRVVMTQLSVAWAPAERLLFAVARDVTQADAQSRALLEARDSLELAQKVARMGSWELDLVNGQLQWSAQVYEIFGVEPGEFAGTFAAFAARVHPDDLPRLVQAQEAVLEGRGELDVQHRIVRRDGGIGYVHERARRVCDENGVPRLLAGTVQDVTAQVLAQQALEKERGFLLAMLENLSDGIVACDAQGNLTLFNRATRELHGLPPEAMSPARLAEHYGLFHADGTTPLAMEQVPLLRALRGETVHDVELVIVPTGQAPRTVLCSGQPIVNAAGQSLGAVVAMRDITESRRARDLEEGQREVLAGIAARRPLGDSLEALTRLYERQYPGALCSILTLDDAGERLLAAAAPSLPAAYVQAIHGQPIGPKAGACGTAAFRRQRVVCADVSTDPLWEDYAAVAAEHGLRACWSTPVVASDGRVLATFANYFRDVRAPGEGEMAVVDGLASLAAVAIEHANAFRALAQALDAAEAGSLQLRRLSESAVTLNRSIGARDMYQQLVDKLRETLGAHQALVSLNLDDNHAQQIHAVSLSEKYSQWARYDTPSDGSGIYSLVCEANRPLRLTQAELEAHPRWRGFGAHAAQHPPMRGWLAVPLIASSGRNIGLLQLSDKIQGEFTGDDELVAVQFAQMASIAIERADLIDKLRVRNRFFDLSLEMFVIFDPLAMRWQQVNTVFAQLLGYSVEELCSREFFEYMHPDDHDATRDRARRMAANRPVPRVFENRYLCRDGSVRWLEWMSERGEDGLVYGVGRDISQRRQAELALRQTLVDLDARNRELQDFAFVASHDLQEPLRKIRAFSDRLQQRYSAELSPEARDYLSRSHQAAARMQTLINDLLAYSRVAARGKPFGPVDMGALLATVVDDLEARLESSGGRIDAGPLPTIEGDPTQLRQMMQNLLSNALKFRDPGRPPVVTVTAESTRLGDVPAWRFSFVDNGIGFEPRYAEKVFVPFQRLHGRQEYEGTGIGLAIVRRIVERHRGTVLAEAVAGEGAKFTVCLPQRQPAAAEAAVPTLLSP